MKKLNLGCGKYTHTDYVNLDFADLPGVDIVHDLNTYPYPFADNYFDEVICVHVLEHLNDIVKPLEEIWRISKNGSVVHIEVPSFPGVGAIVDPTHKQYYTYGTFDYFVKESQFFYYSKAKFNIKNRKILFSSRLFPINIISILLNSFVNAHEKLQRLYFYNFCFLVPSATLKVDLIVVK